MSADGIPRAYVALGANQDRPEKNVLAAMDRLEAEVGTPILRSSLWETEPVDCPEVTLAPCPEGAEPDWVEDARGCAFPICVQQ